MGKEYWVDLLTINYPRQLKDIYQKNFLILPVNFACVKNGYSTIILHSILRPVGYMRNSLYNALNPRK